MLVPIRGCLNKCLGTVASCPAASYTVISELKSGTLQPRIFAHLRTCITLNFNHHEIRLPSMSPTSPSQLEDESAPEAIENEIKELEYKLAQAKLRLKKRSSNNNTTTINGETSHRPRNDEAQKSSHDQLSNTLRGKKPSPTCPAYHG